MNLDYTHSVQDPIVKQQRPGEILRIQWPTGNQTAIWTNLDQELSFTLPINLKCPIKEQMFFCKIIYDVCFDQIDENKKRATPQLNMCKWNANVIWMIVTNDFYQHIWKKTHLTSL